MSGQPSTPSWANREELPNPLGATWIAEEAAWNFAVYSEHAEHVTLLLLRDGQRALGAP
jgi:isoamylase